MAASANCKPELEALFGTEARATLPSAQIML